MKRLKGGFFLFLLISFLLFFGVRNSMAVNIDFGMFKGIPWFQTQEGDVHAGGSIDSSVPEGEKFSLDGLGGFPGLVSYNGLSADFSPGEISSKNWLAKSKSKGNFYSFFSELLKPNFQGTPIDGIILNSDLPGGSGGVKAYKGNIQTGEDWEIGTREIVVLTKGKFLIKNQIKVSEGGSLLVAAQEGIGVSKNLGDSARIEGIFITDGGFYSSIEEDFNFTTAASSKSLTVKGGVIANLISLTRDLGENNSTTPAEKFVYRPDFWLNLYPDLWISYHLWEELAP